ncbi:uncharacterized protein LOC119973664 [Scyliorhinus canicula]|uniref:uncharacterized protein LOC119973664 n=1 Tax=Scyliorhinus canicula TaxID=7830 RepID=UPI0018F3E466|nr:uncharacterized protein LOC119973664 [Scyliorhinus canicula]
MLNEPPDSLSRGTCANVQEDRLRAIHNDLCHPGVPWLAHFIKSCNLPHSTKEVKAMMRACQICAECKPHKARLVKVSGPFEQLSVDFKGPLPSTNRSTYFLTIIDEFPAWFGFLAYIHSHQGTSFMSDELCQYLLSKGIASSRTTSYNPRGNGQVERENATIWKAVLLALRSRRLPTTRWQEVLPDALHSIRLLLCTATNETPHNRLFAFPRKSISVVSLPHWLTTP